MQSISPTTAATVPARQIRALYDAETITLYQAYSPAIASAAVQHQTLAASPLFSLTRMTWIKPSWAWMLYRSGYSLKDPHQSRILALKMRHEHFCELLSLASVHEGGKLSDVARARPVRVQWDPERTVGLEVLPYRSIQIGVGSGVVKKWVEEWIVSIEDVTEKALSLKLVLDDRKDVDLEELIELGYVPVERPFEVSSDLKGILQMTGT